jgi:hypothetical protein
MQQNRQANGCVVARKIFGEKEYDQMLLLKSQYGENCCRLFERNLPSTIIRKLYRLYFDFLGILGL